MKFNDLPAFKYFSYCSKVSSGFCSATAVADVEFLDAMAYTSFYDATMQINACQMTLCVILYLRSYECKKRKK